MQKSCVEFMSTNNLVNQVTPFLSYLLPDIAEVQVVVDWRKKKKKRTLSSQFLNLYKYIMLCPAAFSFIGFVFFVFAVWVRKGKDPEIAQWTDWMVFLKSCRGARTAWWIQGWSCDRWDQQSPVQQPWLMKQPYIDTASQPTWQWWRWFWQQWWQKHAPEFPSALKKKFVSSNAKTN